MSNPTLPTAHEVAVHCFLRLPDCSGSKGCADPRCRAAASEWLGAPSPASETATIAQDAKGECENPNCQWRMWADGLSADLTRFGRQLDRVCEAVGVESMKNPEPQADAAIAAIEALRSSSEPSVTTDAETGKRPLTKDDECWTCGGITPGGHRPGCPEELDEKEAAESAEPTIDERAAIKRVLGLEWDPVQRGYWLGGDPSPVLCESLADAVKQYMRLADNDVRRSACTPESSPAVDAGTTDAARSMKSALGELVIASTVLEALDADDARLAAVHERVQYAAALLRTALRSPAVDDETVKLLAERIVKAFSEGIDPDEQRDADRKQIANRYGELRISAGSFERAAFIARSEFIASLLASTLAAPSRSSSATSPETTQENPNHG